MEWLKRFWKGSFASGKERLILHISFWAVFCFYMRQDSRTVFISSDLPFWVTISGIILHLFLFYPLVYLIFPLIIKKRWTLALLCFIFYFSAGVLIKAYHMNIYGEWINTGYFIQGDGDRLWKDLVASGYKWTKGIGAFFSTLVYLLSEIFIPVWIKILRNALRFSSKQTSLLKENTRLQLEQLRAQINPHLYFNTLNNLQSFIIHNEKENSVQLIGQLADLMRVLLYEVNHEYIPIQTEAKLISNYVAIEKIRFDEAADISEIIKTDESPLQVPPLLLLPLVENAFKYSERLPANEVKILLQLWVENKTIHFNIMNRFSKNHAVRSTGGIGLANLKKRLAHYFSDQYLLDISTENDIFKVNLQIPAHALPDRG